MNDIFDQLSLPCLEGSLERWVVEYLFVRHAN
jgi:hypothetical protein